MLLAAMAGCGHEQGNHTEHVTQNDVKPGSNDLLDKWCNDCHVPPLTNSHPPAEWQGIVMRMQNHRIVKGMLPIPEQEIDRIIHYLQTHAQ